jgi:hypothetical protein
MAIAEIRKVWPIGAGEVGIGWEHECVRSMASYIKGIGLTPEVDKMQVDYELDNLHSSHVLLPLKKNVRNSGGYQYLPDIDNCGANY